MTGPEHYQHAERLLRSNGIEEARVHALLAIAAAVALGPGIYPPALGPDDERRGFVEAWIAAAAEKAKT